MQQINHKIDPPARPSSTKQQTNNNKPLIAVPYIVTKIGTVPCTDLTRTIGIVLCADPTIVPPSLIRQSVQTECIDYKLASPLQCRLSSALIDIDIVSLYNILQSQGFE